MALLWVYYLYSKNIQNDDSPSKNVGCILCQKEFKIFLNCLILKTTTESVGTFFLSDNNIYIIHTIAIFIWFYVHNVGFYMSVYGII